MPKSTGPDWPYKWDTLSRYRLIEIVALWEGRLTTNHLQRAFGIARQQASQNIRDYRESVGPGNLELDTHLKGYRPTTGFSPRVTTGTADEYLHLLNQDNDLRRSFVGLGLNGANTEVLNLPVRNVHPEVLRPLIEAARERLRVDVGYVSLSSPEEESRVIAPHTVVYTGFRWHLRAYCEKNRDYRDFVLSRFRGPVDTIASSIPITLGGWKRNSPACRWRCAGPTRRTAACT